MNLIKTRLLIIAASLVLTTGCSAMKDNENTPGYKPEMRSIEEVKEEVGGLSSRVLEMLRIKGKVTEPGPDVEPCETSASNSVNYYKISHPWSLYGVENKELEKGMENLGRDLPNQGWKVVKNGKDASKNQNLEILAVHLKTRSQLEVTWLRGLDGNEPLIEVTLYSRCFRDSDSAAGTSQ